MLPEPARPVAIPRFSNRISRQAGRLVTASYASRVTSPCFWSRLQTTQAIGSFRLASATALLYSRRLGIVKPVFGNICHVFA